MTKNGNIVLNRCILIPADQESLIKLFNIYNRKNVIPLDQELGINKLPFKISVELMLECAYWAQNQQSYEYAEKAIQKIYNIKINDDTIRQVTNTIGRIVFEEDCRKADETFYKYTKCQLKFNKRKIGVLYIEIDGAALRGDPKTIL